MPFGLCVHLVSIKSLKLVMVSLKPMFLSFILNGTLLFAWQIVSIAIYCDIVMPSIVIFIIITHLYPAYQQNSHTPTRFIITLHTDNEYNSSRLPGQKQRTLALKLIIFLCSFHNSRRLHYALKRNVITLGTVVHVTEANFVCNGSRRWNNGVSDVILVQDRCCRKFTNASSTV